MVYIFICFVFFNIIAYFIPKKLSRVEMYATALFALNYGMLNDVLLDLHYNLYGYYKPGFQWIEIIAIILYFPSINILYLNGYPYRKSIKIKLLYIAGWSVFATLFEWVAVHTNFFYYNGWKLWYSALMYPFIFIILSLNYWIVRKLK